MNLTASIHLFLTCLYLKVTNAWKLPCNCTWVSQFHSFCCHGRIYAVFLQKENNPFQDKKDLQHTNHSCLRKGLPFILSSVSFWVLHVHSPKSLSSFYFGHHAKLYTDFYSNFIKMWQDTGCSVGPALFSVKMLYFSHFSQPIDGAFNPRNKTFSDSHALTVIISILLFAFIEAHFGCKIIYYALKSLSDPQLENRRHKLNKYSTGAAKLIKPESATTAVLN